MESSLTQNTSSADKTTVNHFILKKWLSIVVYSGIIIWGIYGLSDQLIQIFIKYPDVFSTLLKSNNMSLYILLLQQVLFISLSNFIASAYGLAMLIKPSKTVKAFNIVILVFLVTITYYFNTNYQITPDLISQIKTQTP